MKVEKKDLEKSQVELTVELSFDELKPYVKKGANKLSKEVKIDGFRPGHIPYEVLKQKLGEMVILEEGARLAINSTLDTVIKDNLNQDPVGQPQVEIVKLAPENPMVYKVVVAMLPEVKLGDYKNLKIKTEKQEVSDEDLKKTLTELQESRVRESLVDREVKDGDKVLLDINMFLDNVPIEGGQSKNVAVILGKNYIVDGFDKQIIGTKKGDEKTFSLVYPKNHHMQNIAGKKVDFKVKINDVYERILPELNDEFAKGFGFKKYEEFEERIKKDILAHKEKEYEQKKEREMLEMIVNKSRFGDLAEILIDHEGNMMLAELEENILQQGLKFDDYLTSIKKTREQLKLDFLPEAVKRVKVSVMIKEIAKKEGIKANQKQVEEYVSEMLKKYQDAETKKKIDSPEYRAYVANILRSRAVIDKLKEWNFLRK